jgi:hypothetical protein
VQAEDITHTHTHTNTHTQMEDDLRACIFLILSVFESCANGYCDEGREGGGGERVGVLESAGELERNVQLQK